MALKADAIFIDLLSGLPYLVFPSVPTILSIWG